MRPPLSWRDRDGTFDIDASGALPGGQNFNGPSDLMRILAEDKREAFCRCLIEKMLTYALGRSLESSDRCAVDTILGQLAEDEFRFSALATAIALSDPFTLRESRSED